MKVLKGLGATVVDVDMSPFFEAAALLYEGPWVAERYAAIRPFLAKHASDVHPVTRRIIERAKGFSAADAFTGLYRLQALRRATEPVWRGIDALAVPTAPCAPTLAEVAADPIGPNARLGTYTNFVNLLDLAGIAVPGPLRSGRAPRRHHLHRPARPRRRARQPRACIPCQVSIDHRRDGAGAAARCGRCRRRPRQACSSWRSLARICRAWRSTTSCARPAACSCAPSTTDPCYRALCFAWRPAGAAGPRARRRRRRRGHRHRGMGSAGRGFGRFVAGIPAPLGIGTLLLADGTRPKGFLCEAEAVRGAKDISAFGGWRAFVASQA